MPLRPGQVPASSILGSMLQEATAGPDFRRLPLPGSREKAATEHKAQEDQLWEAREKTLKDGSVNKENGFRSNNIRVWLDTLRAEDCIDEIDEYRDKNVADMTVSQGEGCIKVVIQGKLKTWCTEWPFFLEKTHFYCFVPGEQVQLFGLAVKILNKYPTARLDNEVHLVRKCKAVMCTEDHDVFVPWAKSPVEPNDPWWWRAGEPQDTDSHTHKDDRIWGTKAWRLVVDDLVKKWRENGRKPLAHIPGIANIDQSKKHFLMLERVLRGVVEDIGSIQTITDQCHLQACTEARGSALVIMSPRLRIAAPNSSLTWSQSAVARLETSEVADSFMDTRSEAISRAARPRPLPKRVCDVFSGHVLGAPMGMTTRRVRLGRPSEGRYMALSYVWADWEADDALAVARKAAQQTGIRYVWFDKECIDQNDPTDKASEIPKMGDYYANAALVLILDQKFDIPEDTGMTTTGTLTTPSRLRQWAENCWGSIEASSWSKRIWTFQEGICARNPVITNGQRGISLELVEAAMQPFPWEQGLTLVGMKDSDFRRVDAEIRHLNDNSDDPRWTIGTFCTNWMERPMSCSSPSAAIPKMSLHSAFRRTLGREATWREDQIYGLLAIVAGGERVSITYGIREGREATWFELLVKELKKNNLVGLEIMSAAERAAGSGKSWMPKTLDTLRATVGANKMCDHPQTQVSPSTGLKVQASMFRIESRVQEGVWRITRMGYSFSQRLELDTMWEWEDVEGKDVLAVKASSPDSGFDHFMLVPGACTGERQWCRDGIAIRAEFEGDWLTFPTWEIC